MKNFYKGLLLFLFILSLPFFIHAQKPVQNSNLEIVPNELESSITKFDMRVNSKTGIPIAIYKPDYSVNADTPENMAKQYLRDNYAALHLNADLNDIHFTKTIETRGSYHVHFQQFKGSYPVYNSTLNITIDRNNKVVFVMNGYKEDYGAKEEPDLVNIQVSKEDALNLAKNYLGVLSNFSFEKKETIVYYNRGQFRLAQQITLIPSSELFGEWEIMVDAHTGEIFRVEDVALYSGDEGDNPNLVDGSGWVFDPDPITHARTTYGSPGFSDNNDADSDSLTAHVEERTLLDITFDAGVYKLIGPYAEIRDFEDPYTGLHTGTSSDFHYTRSDDNFEAVNTYFHIDLSMRYINTILGFSLAPYQYTGGVRFDPHGLSGSDNSHYLSSLGAVAFGDGGVDDAEDISVVVHELGHGIHDWLTNGGLSQNEGLSEGCGDYWAKSYIRSTGYWTPTDPAYNWIFIWDGHNPFWPGRITNYTAHYPEGLVGQVHTDGQMWSSSLMSIHALIGRTAADSDFLEGMSMTNASSNQQDAANAFIAADQTLYGGSNLSQITPVFIARGYISGDITADFTADVTGGQAPLVVNFIDLSTGINPVISWQWDFNDDGVIDSDIQNPAWTYTESGSYTVSLTVSDGTNLSTETKVNFISVNGGIFVWEGEANGPNYSGVYIRDYLAGMNYQVVYSSAPDLPSSLIGYDAAFLSFGNYGSSGTTNTDLTDDNAAIIVSYLQNAGKVYLEGGDALGYDQSSNNTLLSLFGLASASDGASGNTPVTHLAGQTGTLSDGILFNSSTQPDNNWIDIYTPNSTGLVSFIETSVGNVAVQNEGAGFKTFCFSYALSKLNDETSPSTRANLLDKLAEFFDIVVPVELTSFTASVNNRDVNLLWETATELNNLGFEIERGIEAENFVTIGFKEGNGTTTEKQSYTFQDRIDSEGKIYYRLKQVDFDGSYQYSNIVEVDLTSPLNFSLSQNYPNPFNPSTTIKFNLVEDATVIIQVFSIIGEEVLSLTNKDYLAGKHEIKFDAGILSSGTYIYKLTALSKSGNHFTDLKKMTLMK
jgi:PKD repeat protein